MPYIAPLARLKYQPILTEFNKRIGKDGNDWTSGELNYLISSMLWTVFKKNKSYQTANEIVGVLECIKLEYYRRQVVEYEELKQKENGDLTV